MGFLDIFKSKKIIDGYLNLNEHHTPRYKFTKMLPNDTLVNNEYGEIFEIETTDSYRRIKVAADNNQVDLMLKLCSNLTPPYFVLYVLVISRIKNEPGRYQSKQIESLNEVEIFLNEFKDYIQTDGRHHIWIGTVDNSGLLIYDQHNVIFCYGQFEQQLITLRKESFKELPFSFPVPHAHSYNLENDKFEEQILKYWDWEKHQLTVQDTYED